MAFDRCLTVQALIRLQEILLCPGNVAPRGLMQAGTTVALHQPGRFRQAEHDIHVLDGCSAGAFGQIVDGANQDQSVASVPNRHLYEIGSRNVFRGW